MGLPRLLSNKHLMEILDPGEYDKYDNVLREPGPLAHVYFMIVSENATFARPEEAFNRLTMFQYQVLGIINKLHKIEIDKKKKK